jgi:hypothetical protein
MAVSLSFIDGTDFVIRQKAIGINRPIGQFVKTPLSVQLE